jgi:hypothetical protein
VSVSGAGTGSDAATGPPAALFEASNGAGSAGSGATALGASETVGVIEIVLGSRLGEIVEGSIDDSGGSAADALSEIVTGGEVGLEAEFDINFDTVGLWLR